MELFSSVPKVHEKHEFNYDFLNKIHKEVGLGPITDENLQKIKNDLQFSMIPFECNIGKKNSKVHQSFNSVKRTIRWKFDDGIDDEVFYLDLLKIQPVDGIDLEILLTGTASNMEIDDLDFYFLYIDFYSPEENDWVNIVDEFDLRRIIYGSDSDIINIKSGKIQFSVNTNKLRIRLKCKLKDDDIHVQSRRFNYSGHDFDTNGILYWIGVNENKENRWINPSESGKVKLEISHDKMYDIVEMRKSSIISRDIREPTYWGGTSPQYFIIDLGPDTKAYVDHYTLRHGHYASNSFIYNWQFLGSNDGDNWDILHEQVDSPFTHEFESKTFEVPNPRQFYRYFKVLQKENYSMGSHEGEALPYLCINGFELYGELITNFTRKSLRKSISQINLSVLSLYPIYGNAYTQTMNYVSDFDTNGLIYWIGTKGLTSAYVNPVLSGLIKLDVSHPMYSPDMCKHTIIEREKISPTFWGGSSPQWFTIDLGENILFMCKAYTLRHGYSSPNSFLYNWELHGSLNKKKWDILHSSSETAFSRSFETKTWFITNPKNKFYRYFRVMQKGNYSMGPGKSKKGSPYMCIAGFELYGERLISNSPASKHIDFSKIDKLRLLKSNLYLDKSYHLRLAQLVHKLSCSISLKIKCLDRLLDIFANSILNNTYLIEAMDLPNFIFNNIVKSPKQISEKACRILNVIIHNDILKIKKVILELLLDQFIEWNNHFNNVDNFHYYMMFISLLYDHDPKTTQSKLINILLTINELIKHEKSKFYNVLQSQYGLFGRVLEPNKFTSENESNLSIQNKTQSKLKSITDTESHLLQLQTKFESKKRSLISFLERTENVNKKDVYKAYKECMEIQDEIFLTKENLRLLKPDHPISLDISDCSLDRKIYIVEYILKLINSRSSYFQVDETYTLKQFSDMFKSFCVYGTPTQRHEGTKFLSRILNNHKEYPLKILETFLTSSTKNNPRNNLFPIDFANESLLVLMKQEVHLLYYIIELFRLICKNVDTENEKIDVNLLTWILSLLENLLKCLPISNSYNIFQNQLQQLNPLKPLSIIYRLLVYCVSQQHISSVLFFSANNIIRELTKRYDPKSIYREIFAYNGFNNVLSSLVYLNPILISGTIQTFNEIFIDMNNYLINFKDQPEFDEEDMISVKKSHQTLLNNIYQKFKEYINEHPMIYSEFLLVLFNSISLFNRIIGNSEVPLNKNANLFYIDLLELLIYNIRNFTSIDYMSKARLCYTTLKLLKKFDCSLLMEYNDLFSIFNICLTTPEEYQFIIKDDLLELAEKLISTSETSSLFQCKLFDVIVSVFDQLRSSDRTSVIYKQFIKLFMKNISKRVLKTIKSESLIQLLHGCFSYIVSIPKKEISTSVTIKKVVIPTLHLCEIILILPNLAYEVRTSMLSFSNSYPFPSLMIEFFRNAEVDIDQIIIRKHSFLNPTERIIKCSLRIIQSLSKDIQAAKHFIELCLNSLRLNSQSCVIYKVLLQLIKDEEIAQYFCIHLKGYEFMISQFKGSQYTPNSHKYKSQTSSFSSNEDGLTNFTQKISVIEPLNDPLLSGLFKGNIWCCNSIDQSKKKFSMTLSLNEVSIIKEIHVSFDTAYSQHSIPEYMTVEIGSSPDLFLPVGSLKINKFENHSNNTHNVLYINENEVSLYLKLNFICKKRTNTFTINNIKILGYSADSYPISNDYERSDHSFPIMLYLQTLEQCTKYEEVQKHITSYHSDTYNLALTLLDISDSKLHYIIQKFLYNISYNDMKIGDLIFDYILNNQTSYSLFTSKLCLIECENTSFRLEKLSNHIITLLKTRNKNAISFIESLAIVIYRLSQRNNSNQAKISLKVLDLFNEAIKFHNESDYQNTILKLLSSYISKDKSAFACLISKYIDVDIDELILFNYPIIQFIGYLGGINEHTTKQLIDNNVLNSLRALIQNKDIDYEILEKILSFLTNISYNSKAKRWMGKHIFNLCFRLIISQDTPTNIILKVYNLLIKSQNLCYENKEKIAIFILNLMKSTKTKLKKFHFQFITEMLVLEDQISIVLTPKNETPIENNALSYLSKEKSFIIEMDKDFTHESIELLEDNQVIKASDVPSKWRTSIAKKGFTYGYHTWDVVIEECTNFSNIMIGVCEKDHNLNLWLGQSQSSQGWSYYGSTTGYTYHNGVFETGYGKLFKKGDTVHVYLDMDNGTIGFGLNGEDFGVAFSSDIYGRELYPAVSLYDSGDRLRIKPSNENEKIGRPIESTEPLFFHTPFKPFQFPISTTIDSIASNILPNKLKYTHSIEFEYHYPKRNEFIGILDQMNTKLEDIVQILDNEKEIIELRFLINQSDDSYDKKSIHTISGNSRDHNWLIFEIFSNKGGLILLINELIDQIEDRLSIRRDKDMKSNKYLLKSLLTFTSVDGFIEAFIKDNECRAILLKIMYELQNICQKDIEAKISSILPEVNIEALRDPYGCFVKVFIDILSSREEKSIEELITIRNKMINSDVINRMLVELMFLLDILPRDPNYHFFKPYIRTYNEEKNRKMKKHKVQPKQPASPNKGSWNKGTGYCAEDEDDSQSKWEQDLNFKEQNIKNKKASQILKAIASVLRIYPESTDKIPKQHELSNNFYEAFIASSIQPLLENYYRNSSILDIVTNFELYSEILNISRAIAGHEKLIPLFGKIPNQSLRLIDIFENLYTLSCEMLSFEQEVEDEEISESSLLSEEDEEFIDNDLLEELMLNRNIDFPEMVPDNEESHLIIASDIKNTYLLIKQVWDQYCESHPENNIDESTEGNATIDESEYVRELQIYKLQEYDMKDPKTGEYNHHFKNRITSESSPAYKMKRILHELGSLRTSLPVHESSSIFLSVDSERIDIMKAIIIGPENTPYENGCFIFDIYCPPEYPKSPPLVNLQTTGNGSVRFNPNLYNCGKVCLSLLGTWRGGPNEKWSEHTSTLLQVLISIQSLIFVNEPYFNEPGYENLIGTEEGKEQSLLYNETIKIATLRWALVNQLKNPTPEFEEVIKLHFLLKRDSIIKQAKRWLSEAKKSNTPEHYQTMKAIIDELFVALQELEPFEIKNEESADEEEEEPDVISEYETVLQELEASLPGFIPELYVKALELNNGEYIDSINWLLDNGEKYLLKHPELLTSNKRDKKKSK